MDRIFVPTIGPSDWRRLLGDPRRHWKQGRSAYELAIAWEAAAKSPRGLPRDVERALDAVPELAGASLVVGLPEHQVPLDGGGHPSQTDLWALLATAERRFSVSIEAKAGEPFDELVSTWLSGASKGKRARLQQLCSILGITQAQAEGCRYQLLHRPVTALLEAPRFGASDAIFLVQSFCPSPEAFQDFAHFGRQVGASVRENQVVYCGVREGTRLWIGWISSAVADDASVRVALW